MSFENPEIPDGINVSEKHPLRDFASLLLAVVALSALLAAAAALGAGYLARHVPFRFEMALADPYLHSAPPDSAPRRYLQQIADRLVAAAQLPPSMQIHLHYSERPEVNAFATLGGNVVVFRGLLAKVRSENEIAMVLAHEIAHVKHRHPIVSLGRGIAIAAMLASVSSSAGRSVAGGVMRDAGLLTQLTFTRGQENDADETALAALVGAYGHAGGATDLFETLQGVETSSATAVPAVLLTHPHLSERVLHMRTLAQQHGWTFDAARQPLPAEIAQSLARAASKDKEPGS